MTRRVGNTRGGGGGKAQVKGRPTAPGQLKKNDKLDNINPFGPMATTLATSFEVPDYEVPTVDPASRK